MSISGLYHANNWESSIIIKNMTNENKLLTVDQPIKVYDVEKCETNNYEEKYEINNYEEKYEINNCVLSKIRDNHLNKEESIALRKIVGEFNDLFQLEGQALTFTNKIKHEIKTVDDVPVYTKTYRYPYVHKEEVGRQIEEMLEQNIIRNSYSPWSSPIWIVPKKEDASGKKKWRLVIDYRKVNAKTVDDRYPIPNITEILDKLGKCMYFSTLDLASGFHQIEINPKDIPKTAFNVEHGHYEFVRMPFGLKNAPATFQRVMDNVLHELQGKCCLVYMDDIIIYSTSLQEHIVNLKKVFLKLREANFKVQLDKSEFLHKEVNFLGHVVSEDGIKPNPMKIEAIKKYPIPKTPKQIKQFLGLLGYYRRFIKDFAKLTKPMTSMLKKNNKLNIEKQEYKECFQLCKEMLITEPILAYPDFTKPFLLITDASDFALGSVLSQVIDGKEHPICYASRTLNEHEINYSTIEKELLSIVWSTKYFRPYLYGRKFKIQTDHKPLNWLMSLKEPNSKLVRWRLKLEEFDYEIEYKPGKINSNADALSRIEININESSSDTIHSAESDNQNLIPITETCLNSFKTQIIFEKNNSGSASIRQMKFFKNTRKIIKLKEFDEKTLIEIFKKHMNPNNINCILVEDNNLFIKIQDVYKKYFFRYKLLKTSLLVKDVINEDEQDEIIKNCHLENNHRGINENILHIKRKYYFPKIDSKVTKYVNLCKACQENKYERKPD